MNLSKFLAFAWLVLCVSAYANSTQKTKQESKQSIINPSFDCKKARTNTEKLICSDKELAALDKEMAQAYKKARVSLDKAGRQTKTFEKTKRVAKIFAQSRRAKFRRKKYKK